MKPDKQGVWEWFDENGVKRLVEVFNVEHDPNCKPYLRVYFAGGYYNVHDLHEQLVTIDGRPCGEYLFKAEWPDRWGIRVGEIGSVSEERLYSMYNQ